MWRVHSTPDRQRREIHVPTALSVGRYEITAGLVDNHGDILTREHVARVRGHDGKCKVDAFAVEDLRNFALVELDPSLSEGLGVGTAAGPELTENPPFVVGLDTELCGELDTLVQMAAADVPARTCRECRDRPELAAVTTVSTVIIVGGRIRFPGGDNSLARHL